MPGIYQLWRPKARCLVCRCFDNGLTGRFFTLDGTVECGLIARHPNEEEKL
jgi:hypothetical protein